MAPKVSSAVFVSFSGSLVLLIVIYPWMLGVILVFGLLGYFYIDLVNDRIKKFVQDNHLFLVDENDEDKIELKSDPLLNIPRSSSFASSSTCSVCPVKNCTRDGEGHQQCQAQSPPSPTSSTSSRKPSPSPKHSPSFPPIPSYAAGLSRGDNDLRINPRLDAALSRFCTTVFDYYISRMWAPYETRKHLKLAFKKLLTNFAERIKTQIIVVNENGEASAEKFCRKKLLPLFIHHVKEITKSSHRPNLCELEQKQNLLKIKVRMLCRTVLEKCLSEEDLRCTLWMELCVSVLSDGVLWNLIKLGQNEIPTLIEATITQLTKSRNLSDSFRLKQPPSMDMSQENNFENKRDGRPRIPPEGEDTVDSMYDDPLQKNPQSLPIWNSQDEKHENYIKPKEIETNKVIEKSNVPFLLDSYLDPVNDIDQPDDIASRWRPKLSEILEERELLYCLIQYLKGHKALEYLQAVLDDSADAKEYCRKVLELEYLPCFCRSSFFLEKMGLNRVDDGFEPQSETNSTGSSRPNSGHTRSASFGGANSGLTILQFGQGVVDGLPLYQTPSVHPAYTGLTNSSSPGLVLPGAGTMEPDFVFKRKPTLESTITKFLNSTHTSTRNPAEVLGDRPEAVKRAGVDSKTYEDLNQPDLHKSVIIKDVDIFEATVEAVTSSISINPWLGPMASGWLQLLQPYLKPHFDAHLEKKLNEFLTLDLCVNVVDLISDAFIGDMINDETDDDIKSVAEQQNNRNTVQEKWSSLAIYLATSVIDVESLFKSLHQNKDDIMLFFVDALDVFVSEIS